MGQRLAPLINEIAKAVVKEAGRYPRSVIRGYNLVVSLRVHGIGGELVLQDSDGMCQWIPPRHSEFFLLGSFSLGEDVYGIPRSVEEYHLLRLHSGKELFIKVRDDAMEQKQRVTIVASLPKRVVGAMLKRIGAAMCDGASPVLVRK